MATHFFLLGDLRIVHNERIVASPSYRVQNLLAFLLLRPRISRREQIAEALYPELAGVQGRRSLSDVLYQLRKRLPAGTISSDRACVQLPEAARWLDVDIFRKALASDSPETWEAGLSLYRGDLLPGNYEDWLLEEREALHLDFVALAHRFGETMLRQGDYDRALSVTERLVREELYDEKALQRLMQLYQALGRRGDALRVYEQFVERLAADLGVEPHPGVQMQAQAIHDACPTFFPDDYPLSADVDDVDADALLKRGRQALERGRLALAEAMLMQFGSQSPPTDAMHWLAFDLALRFDEIERAQRALAHCDPDDLRTMVRKAALRLAQRNWESARDMAERALLGAISEQERQVEGWALWALASAEYRLGRRADAYRAGERALALARTNHLPLLTGDCLLLLGRMLVLEGRFGQAGPYVSEAAASAQRHDAPWHYVQAMRLSGRLHARTGRLLAAQRDYEEALRACRHLGWFRVEARLLNELAESCDLLGQSERSLRLLRQAEFLLTKLADPMPLAINYYNQAFTYLYLGDDRAPLAVARAHSALDVFRERGQKRWMALGWMALAYAYWIDGAFQRSLRALDESLRLHEFLGEYEKFCEILAMKAQVHLALGNLDQALDCSQAAVLALAQGARATDMKAEVFFARSAALAAAGRDEEALNFVRGAYESLLSIAAKLADDQARRAFFRRDPITRRLMEAVYARGIAEPLEAGQLTRWLPSQRNDYAVQVRWTVDAGPADVALKQHKGAIILRRQRLARLIQEAETQGIDPRNKDLAAALGVSVRTIQRDRTHLQQAAMRAPGGVL